MSASAPLRSDEGSALLAVLLGSLLIVAVGLVLLRVADVDVGSASSQVDAREAAYAAEAMLEAAVAELAPLADWSAVLDGRSRSSLWSSSSAISSALVGVVDVSAWTAEIQGLMTARGDWGMNTPRWRLFAVGSLRDLVGVSLPDEGPLVAAWVADDEGEVDGDVWGDSNGTIRVRGESRGRRGSRRGFEAVIRQTATVGVVRRVTWFEGR